MSDQPRVVCAWCKCLMCEGAEPVSHGCCERCKERVLSEHPLLEIEAHEEEVNE